MKYFIEVNPGVYFTGDWSKETPRSDGNGMHMVLDYAPQFTKDFTKAKIYTSFAGAEGDAIGAKGWAGDYMDCIKEIT